MTTNELTPPRVFGRTANSALEVFLVSALAVSCLVFSWLLYSYDAPFLLSLFPIILGGPFLAFWLRSDIKKLVVHDDFVEICYLTQTRKIPFADVSEVCLESWSTAWGSLTVALALRDGKIITMRWATPETTTTVFNALDAAIKAKGTATQEALSDKPESDVTKMMIQGILVTALFILPFLLIVIWIFLMQ